MGQPSVKRQAIAAVAVAVACLFVLVCLGHRGGHVAGASVIVNVQSGHGSGVHIGNGYVVTAAHVIADEPADGITIGPDHGADVPASVLWSSEQFDVALLYMPSKPRLAVAQIACRAVDVGEDIEAVGNPSNLRFVHTRGVVARGAALDADMHISVFVADMTVGPGMSGGPVFDRRGDLIGLVDAILTPQLADRRSFLPLSFIVPSTSICALLAR